MASITFFGCLILGIFVHQVFGLKQNSIQETSLPLQYIPPQRFCGCEELNRCINDQSTRDHNLLTACRQECGARIFLDPTLKKVVGCYDTFDHKRNEADSHRRQCVESMGSRQCISDHHVDTPATFTINTTEYLQGNKRCSGNRKLALPDSVNQLNLCTRTCVQNLGIVQFNADGSIVKPATTKAAKNGEKQEQEKNGKENGNGHGAKTAQLCATLLNCQLSPLDKKLDKQAKQLCKFKPGTHEDTEMALCTCLESALGQNLRCTEQMSPPEPCTSATAQCPHDKNIGHERR